MKIKFTLGFVAGFMFVLVLLLGGHQSIVKSQSSTTLWSKQFGTASNDEARSVVTDNQGNVYIAGNTDGSLFGQNNGDSDVYLCKYDTNGNLLWSQQFGSNQEDTCGTLVIDSQNSLYVIGATRGNLFGTNSGANDVFLAKYDQNGNQIWTKQFGSAGDDCAYGAAIDNQNNLYVSGLTDGSLFGSNAGADASGQTSDAFIVKYNSAGSQIWAKQFGAVGEDVANDITIDHAGNVIVTGCTSGTLFRQKVGTFYAAFLGKYDANGNLIWGNQFDSTYGRAAGAVCTDAGNNIYFSSSISTFNSDTLESDDAIISKYDTNGNLQWSDTLSTPVEDDISRVCLDGLGNILIAGTTKGNLFGPNTGNEDVFVAKYDSNGNGLWGKQYGTSNQDDANDLCVDNQGNIFIVGYTNGNLFSANAQADGTMSDAFIQKISPSGQTAFAKLHRLSPYKPLLFAWSGQTIPLSYPPLLANKQPYVYAGYLCSGIPGAKVQRLAAGKIAVLGRSKQVVIDPHSRTYQINGKPRLMSAKPVLVDGQCYVPLDVMKAVLPYPVTYEAKAQRVRFDPPQKKVARR